MMYFLLESKIYKIFRIKQINVQKNLLQLKNYHCLEKVLNFRYLKKII